MVGGVISDIYQAEDRNTPMSFFAGSVLFGTGLGPLISGFIQQRASWQWIYYSQAIAAAVFLLILFFFLKETRGSVLLSRKAKVLNKYYDALEDAGYRGLAFELNGLPEKQKVQRIRWKVKSDEERESLAKMISISCYRPFRKYQKSLQESELVVANLRKTSSSLSQWCSFSRFGSLSAGQFSTSNSVPCLLSFPQTMGSMLNKMEPFSQVCLPLLLLPAFSDNRSQRFLSPQL